MFWCSSELAPDRRDSAVVILHYVTLSLGSAPPWQQILERSSHVRLPLPIPPIPVAVATLRVVPLALCDDPRVVAPPLAKDPATCVDELLVDAGLGTVLQECSVRGSQRGSGPARLSGNGEGRGQTGGRPWRTTQAQSP